MHVLLFMLALALYLMLTNLSRLFRETVLLGGIDKSANNNNYTLDALLDNNFN